MEPLRTKPMRGKTYDALMSTSLFSWAFDSLIFICMDMNHFAFFFSSGAHVCLRHFVLLLRWKIFYVALLGFPEPKCAFKPKPKIFWKKNWVQMGWHIPIQMSRLQTSCINFGTLCFPVFIKKLRVPLTLCLPGQPKCENSCYSYVFLWFVLEMNRIRHLRCSFLASAFWTTGKSFVCTAGSWNSLQLKKEIISHHSFSLLLVNVQNNIFQLLWWPYMCSCRENMKELFEKSNTSWFPYNETSYFLAAVACRFLLACFVWKCAHLGRQFWSVPSFVLFHEVRNLSGQRSLVRVIEKEKLETKIRSFLWVSECLWHVWVLILFSCHRMNWPTFSCSNVKLSSLVSGYSGMSKTLRDVPVFCNAFWVGVSMWSQINLICGVVVKRGSQLLVCECTHCRNVNIQGCFTLGFLCDCAAFLYRVFCAQKFDYQGVETFFPLSCRIN